MSLRRGAHAQKCPHRQLISVRSALGASGHRYGGGGH